METTDKAQSREAVEQWMETIHESKLAVHETRLYRDTTIYASVEMDDDEKVMRMRSIARFPESASRPLEYLVFEHNQLVAARRVVDGWEKGIYTQEEVFAELLALVGDTRPKYV